MKKIEKDGKGPFPIWVQLSVVILIFGIAAYFILSGRENAQKEHDRVVHGVVVEPQTGRSITYTEQPKKAITPMHEIKPIPK